MDGGGDKGDLMNRPDMYAPAMVTFSLVDLFFWKKKKGKTLTREAKRKSKANVMDC